MWYAEVMLMFAEATNEVNGPTLAVQNAINQIRDRADVKIPTIPVNLTKDQMREKIRKERRIELCFEGFRFNNLKRNYHWPIPQAEINKSNDILKQNPDYL